ncbi:MAG: hypothetical protein ACTS2F_28895 [Thainema sp.]
MILDQLETDTNIQLISDWAMALQQRDPNLTTADCEEIAFVVVKAIRTFLWLSLGQDKTCKQC